MFIIFYSTQCYANTRCDGRDTPPPTVSPAPSVLGANKAKDGEVCTICGQSKVDESLPVIFNKKSTTCGDAK